MGDLLVACVNGQAALIASLLESVDLTRLADAAVYHGAESAVYRALKSSPIPTALKHDLRLLNTAAIAGHLRALSDLRWLTTELESLGVEWAVLKGPVLAEAIYTTGSQRTYGDLDVLLEPAVFGDVVRSLEQAGARLVDVNWPMMIDGHRGELSMLLPHGTPLDLHWHVFLDPAVRREFPVSTSQLLSRRRKVDIDGVSIPTLDRADTLVHLCAHAALSGAHRLVWLKDIEQAVRNEPPNWATVAERTRQADLDAPVAIALARSVGVIGTPVPSAVFRSLRTGRTWVRGVRALDAARPPHHGQPGLFSGRLLVRSTRATTVRSTASLMRALDAFVRKDLLANPTHPWRTRRVAPTMKSDSNPLHQPNGSTRDRANYFDFVASTSDR